MNDTMNNTPHCLSSNQDSLDGQIEAARGGSKDALGQVVVAYRAYLASVVRKKLPSRLNSKVGASDIVQETLFKACRGFHRFTGATRRDLIRWLRRILLNNLIDAVRHRFKASEVPLYEWTFDQQTPRGRTVTEVLVKERDPGSQVAIREEAVRLHRALATLPEDYRCVVLLRNHDRLTFGEIGQRMGRTDEAVRKLWVRAILKLQSQLDTAN